MWPFTKKKVEEPVRLPPAPPKPLDPPDIKFAVSVGVDGSTRITVMDQYRTYLSLDASREGLEAILGQFQLALKMLNLIPQKIDTKDE